MRAKELDVGIKHTYLGTYRRILSLNCTRNDTAN